jgi:hypothetical protein
MSDQLSAKQPDAMKMQPPASKTFEIVTTAQVERTYKVQAKDEEQARARLRTHLSDPYMLRDGVVVEQREKQADATPQRIKAAVKATVKP